MITTNGGPPPDDEGLIICEGFNEAVLGVGRRCGQPDVVVYDYSKMKAILVDDGMGEYEATEYINTLLSEWVGDQTPVILYREDWADA